MKLNFKEILEGWKNDLFPAENLKQIIRDTQEERLAICKTCPFNSTPNTITAFTRCKDCGCPLKKKTACLSCICPQEKWSNVLTPDEDTELQTKTNYKEHEEES